MQSRGFRWLPGLVIVWLVSLNNGRSWVTRIVFHLFPKSFLLKKHPSFSNPPITRVCSTMRLTTLATATLASIASATILQNGQVRPNNYPNTAIAAVSSHNSSWETYSADAPELSYKGRWDDRHISWW